MAAIPRRVRFSTEIPLERERRLEIQREQRRRRRQQEIAEHSETNADSKRQRNRGTGDWNIRGIVAGNPCRYFFSNVPLNSY